MGACLGRDGDAGGDVPGVDVQFGIGVARTIGDMEMYTTTQPQPDPERFLNQFVSWEIANKENKWLGRNVSRYTDPAADEAYKAAQKELDPAKRAAFLIKVNEIFCEANVILPLLSRTRVAAALNNISHDHSGWDVDTWNIAAWYRS